MSPLEPRELAPAHERLVIALRELHEATGGYPPRRLQDRMRENDNLRDSVSHERIRQIPAGRRGLPRWLTVESLIRTMAPLARPPREPDQEANRIYPLWRVAAGFAEPSETITSPQSTPPVQFAAPDAWRLLSQDPAFSARQAAIHDNADRLWNRLQSLRERHAMADLQTLLLMIGVHSSTSTVKKLIQQSLKEWPGERFGTGTPILLAAGTRQQGDVKELFNMAHTDGWDTVPLIEGAARALPADALVSLTTTLANRLWRVEAVHLINTVLNTRPTRDIAYLEGELGPLWRTLISIERGRSRNLRTDPTREQAFVDQFKILIDQWLAAGQNWSSDDVTRKQKYSEMLRAASSRDQINSLLHETAAALPAEHLVLLARHLASADALSEAELVLRQGGTRRPAEIVRMLAWLQDKGICPDSLAVAAVQGLDLTQIQELISRLSESRHWLQVYRIVHWAARVAPTHDAEACAEYARAIIGPWYRMPPVFPTSIASA